MLPLKNRDPRRRFLEVFGFLFPKNEWAPLKLEGILASLQFREMEAGTTILREGQVCGSVPFVLEGAIRVFKTAESGREITLYRIEAGQTCILSSGCGTSIVSFPASAVAESETGAAFMSTEMVRRLLAEGASFRDYVLAQYSRRMAEVMELVEEVAFRRVDERLAQWLTEHSSGEETADPEKRRARFDYISATHQELADHVGTSREVVSRILKDWEQRKVVEISRGSLRLLPGFESMRESGRAAGL
jgi:CRP/FNR family transcriptional regulator, anaerobic regulatory protein